MVGSEKARATNMNCEVVTVVTHDKSAPVVDVTYSKLGEEPPGMCLNRAGLGVEGGGRFERWDTMDSKI